MKTLDIIQGFCDHVFRDKKGNRIFPNIFVGKWEADLLEVTDCDIISRAINESDKLNPAGDDE